MQEIIHKSFKFRLLPTKEQKEILSKHFGCTRFVYNHFLKEKQDHYLNNGKTLNFNNSCKSLTELKGKEEFGWLKEVNSQALQAALKNLETAYGRFFSKKSKFPNFKKKSGKNSFICPQGSKIKKDILLIPKFKEGIKLIQHRPIKGKICFVTVSKSKTGKYFASITCEIQKPKPLIKTGKTIGIDLGLKDFVVTSVGSRFNNPRFLKQLSQKLNHEKKNFSRKQKDSKRKEKQRLKVARIYEKITNSRENMQHQISSKLIKSYDVIAVENLNVKGMMANHTLAGAIADVGWTSFISKLKYKAEWTGRTVVEIDRFYPSSKTCSNCNHIYKELSLKERSWTCSDCNTIHDRDTNAAKNILRRGISVISDGTSDYGRGDEIRPIEIVKKSKGIVNEVSKKKRNYTLKPILLKE